MPFLNTRERTKKKYIFVLLGPSGTGKTTFAKRQSNGKTILSLSTGEELRKQNVMRVWQEFDMTAIKDFCHKLITKTFEQFTSSKTHEILILDCVKDLEDAEFIAAQVKKHDLEITRALLFDIDPELLNKHWISRGEDRDLFRGSTQTYLRNWNIKSNSILNYYKKFELLCKMFINSSDVRFFKLLLYDDNDDIFENYYPLLPSQNNLRYVITNSAKIENILAELCSILKVNQLKFTLPASFVHCYRDVKWVTDPARYHVTAKTDGVRCLLMKIHDGTYLITRKNEIYPCSIADDKLPIDTVLDGELLPSSLISKIHPIKVITVLKTSMFLVFDVLAVSGNALWKWPFAVRHENLRELPISNDIAAVMKQAQASAYDKISANQKLQSINVEEDNLNELEISCVVKEHTPSSTNEVLKFIETLSQLPYPCDGIVFTPNTAYVFGPDPLLFKWQSEDSVHCDILMGDLKSNKRKCAVNLATEYGVYLKRRSTTTDFSCFRNEKEVLECQWNHLENAWDPLFVRQDKSVPNSEQTIDHVEKLCQQPYTVKHLIKDLTEIECFDELQDTTNTTASSNVNHPSIGYSYDELYAKISNLVQLGYVEKTVDSVNNLEIVNYSTSVSDPLVSFCRGLVLHPDSKSIVTKPFTRFFEDVGQRDPDEVVKASIKYDGSLGIAFLWNKDVMVTTRRRMDSEQAIWAKQWINDHCNLTMFQEGYTYLFEIIYQSNTMIVNYLFEGLVLLAITNENGQELSYEELLHYARTIGFFMVTPQITGSYSDILWYCGGIDIAMQWNQHHSFVSGALPTNKQQEGWVVKFLDGNRQKIIYRWWKDVSKLTNLVHPQIVWLLVKHDKFRYILGNVPSHFRIEIYRMIRALWKKFVETVRHIEQYLTVSSLKSQDLDKSLEEVHGEWWWMGFPPVSDESEDSEDDKNEQSSMYKQTEQMCLEEAKDMTSNRTTSKDEKQRFEESDVVKTSEEKDFIKLAYKFEPYWNVDEYSKTKDQYSETEDVSPIYNQMYMRTSRYLRLPVLDYICPTSAVLDGYEPSDNFKQTWCKGWKSLPINDIQFIQEVLQDNHSNPPLLQFPVEVIVLLLEFLDGTSLATMSRVCMQLRRIVQSSQVLRKKIAVAKNEHDIMVAELESQSYHYSYSPRYSWGSAGSY